LALNVPIFPKRVFGQFDAIACSFAILGHFAVVVRIAHLVRRLGARRLPIETVFSLQFLVLGIVHARSSVVALKSADFIEDKPIRNSLVTVVFYFDPRFFDDKWIVDVESIVDVDCSPMLTVVIGANF
jgi:hypothetical protein|tara:strand:- start:373 stop:756 length:384 start_codon:yes stop_codon:yes gene_type:complete